MSYQLQKNDLIKVTNSRHEIHNLGDHQYDAASEESLKRKMWIRDRCQTLPDKFHFKEFNLAAQSKCVVHQSAEISNGITKWGEKMNGFHIPTLESIKD